MLLLFIMSISFLSHSWCSIYAATMLIASQQAKRYWQALKSNKVTVGPGEQLTTIDPRAVFLQLRVAIQRPGRHEPTAGSQETVDNPPGHDNVKYFFRRDSKWLSFYHNLCTIK